MASYQRYIGIDYSGAECADSALPGLSVYLADQATLPVEVAPPAGHVRGPKKYWTREKIAKYLVDTLSAGPPAIVGIDHSFSFPWQYFSKYDLEPRWPTFLDDFQRHWPTDTCGYVDFVREGLYGNGAARTGLSTWRRLCERRAGRAKSVFHFDVQGSVAKSTHSGLPWLRYLRMHAGESIHFWPFDGWTPAPKKSVVLEVYPALWKKSFPREGRNDHQHDAYSVAAWLRASDRADTLHGFFAPELNAEDRLIAKIEGWILGVR